MGTGKRTPLLVMAAIIVLVHGNGGLGNFALGAGTQLDTVLGYAAVVMVAWYIWFTFTDKEENPNSLLLVAIALLFVGGHYGSVLTPVQSSLWQDGVLAALAAFAWRKFGSEMSLSTSTIFGKAHAAIDAAEHATKSVRDFVGTASADAAT